jgi:hypothetical protein
MKLRIFLVVAVAVALSADFAAAAQITLTPSSDGTLIQDTTPSAQLANGLGDIFVGRTNQDGQEAPTVSIRRGLVEFDIADNIPADATITGVSLTMREATGNDGSQTVTLYDVLQAWGQGTSFQNGGMGAAATNNDATWLYTFYNAANPSASPTWNTPGGSFSSTASASQLINDNSQVAESFSWSSAQMIADVQSWLNDPSQNFGWLLQGNEAQGKTAKQFNGMYSTTSPEVPPELTITYTVPEPSAIALWLAAGAALSVGWGLRRRM